MRPSTTRLLFRGFTLRCPRCGGGRLFRRWFRMMTRCPRCEYPFEREEGFFLGAYVINLAVTQFAVIAFLIVGIAVSLPHPRPAVLVPVGVAVAIITPLV